MSPQVILGFIIFAPSIMVVGVIFLFLRSAYTGDWSLWTTKVPVPDKKKRNRTQKRGIRDHDYPMENAVWAHGGNEDYHALEIPEGLGDYVYPMGDTVSAHGGNEECHALEIPEALDESSAEVEKFKNKYLKS